MKDMDVSVLFEKYSIDEIREIEKKTRYLFCEISANSLCLEDPFEH